MLKLVLGAAILLGLSAPALAYAPEQRCRLPAKPPVEQAASRIPINEAESLNPGRKQYVSREQAEADKALTCQA